jgi:hypothetical protein
VGPQSELAILKSAERFLDEPKGVAVLLVAFESADKTEFRASSHNLLVELGALGGGTRVGVYPYMVANLLGGDTDNCGFVDSELALTAARIARGGAEQPMDLGICTTEAPTLTKEVGL